MFGGAGGDIMGLGCPPPLLQHSHYRLTLVVAWTPRNPHIHSGASDIIYSQCDFNHKFMLNSKYTNKQNIKPVFMHMYPEILTARHITHWYYHGVSFNCILIFNFYIQCNINMVVGVTDCTIFCTLYFTQVYVIKKLRQWGCKYKVFIFNYFSHNHNPLSWKERKNFVMMRKKLKSVKSEKH